MKKMKWLFIILVSCCFISCLDTVEQLDIKESGAGTLNMNMDMGKAAEMMKGFMAPEELAKEKLDRVIDTTILMKDVVDTSTKITPERKALLRNGKMHLTMNLANNILKMDMSYPYQSQAQLTQIYAALQDGGMNMGSMMQALSGGDKDDAANPAPGGADAGDNPSQLSNVYDITVTPTQYKRVLNKERYQKMMSNPKIEEAKGMSSMMGEMNYTIALNLPRPVKKVSNSKAVISNDKKNVMLKSDLFAIFDHPELLELTVDY
jgi:hypothetical protein